MKTDDLRAEKKREESRLKQWLRLNGKSILLPGLVMVFCFLFFSFARADGLSAVSADGMTSYTVAYGESVELAVEASGGTAPYQYEWMVRTHYDDQDENFIAISDDAGSRRTVGPITEGTAYICHVRDATGKYANEVTFRIYVENALTAQIVGSSQIYAHRGEEVTLSVAASCTAGGLEYHWHDAYFGWNYGDRPDVSQSSVTIKVQGEDKIYCSVWDQYKNVVANQFNIHLINHLTVSAEGDQTIRVSPGESATMRVSASSESGDPADLSYLWIKEGSPKDIFSTENWCIVDDVQETGVYSCTVKDEYGNEKSVAFTIEVDNQLTVNGKGVGEWPYVYLTVPYGGEYTMQPEASCARGALSYEWQKFIENVGYMPIAGANTASYTATNITESQDYQCIVSDEYKNSITVAYTLSIDNQFEVSAVRENISIMPGEDVTLQVQASCKTGDLSYQWYEVTQYEENSFDSIFIPEVKGDTYTLKNVQEDRMFSCVVTDIYGNSVGVLFRILLKVDSETILLDGLELNNIACEWNAKSDPEDPDVIGSLRFTGNVLGPSNVVGVWIAWWANTEPTAQEAFNRAQETVSYWKDGGPYPEYAVPYRMEIDRDVYAYEAGRTQYTLLVGLDRDVNLIGYAVVKTTIPTRQEAGGKRLMLPRNLTVIESEAFLNVAATEIDIPDGVTSIGDHAFPDGVTLIMSSDSPWWDWAVNHGYRPVMRDP